MTGENCEPLVGDRGHEDADADAEAKKRLAKELSLGWTFTKVN